MALWRLKKAAKLSEIPPGSIKKVQVGEQAIALGKRLEARSTPSTIPALHRGGPLGEASWREASLPAHAWLAIQRSTGKAVQNPNAGVSCFATELRGDEFMSTWRNRCNLKQK